MRAATTTVPATGTELAVFAIDEALPEIAGNSNVGNLLEGDEAPRLWHDDRHRADAGDRQVALAGVAKALAPGGLGYRGRLVTARAVRYADSLAAPGG